jgi:hypothetical protein
MTDCTKPATADEAWKRVVELRQQMEPLEHQIKELEDQLKPLEEAYEVALTEYIRLDNEEIENMEL